jgi:hypothetical protein
LRIWFIRKTSVPGALSYRKSSSTRNIESVFSCCSTYCIS